MNLRDVDLNLLVILDAVVTEQSITAAAATLGMKQPAVSRSIARLRELVDFELIKRRSHGVEPTERARELIEQVRPALVALSAALAKPKPFDPRTSQREFMLDVAGGLEATMAASLAARLADAPGLKISIGYGHARGLQSELRYGISSLALDFEAAVGEGYSSELLFESPLAVITRRHHPGLSGPMTLDDYGRLKHVALNWSQGADTNPLDPHLARLGIVRDSPLIVPTIAALSFTCEASDLLGTISARSARMAAARWAVDVHPMPLALPPIRIYMAWHSSYDGDLAHQWLRRTLKEIVAEQDALV